jgi:hypothetical protein
MRSVSDLTYFLPRHSALDGDQDIHAGNPRVDPIVGDHVHVQVLEFLLDRVHLGFGAPQA